MAEAAPVLSVVVPARDAARWIRECLHSINVVAAGLDGGHEIVVVDDASTDGTGAEALAAEHTVVIPSEGTGIGAALNTGLARAGGDVVGWSDADDRWVPHDLARRLAAVRASGYGVSVGLLRTIDAAGTPTSAAAEAWVRGGLLVASGLVRRVGPFRTDVAVGEFVDWWARAQELQPHVHHHSELVYERRVHGENTVVRRIGERSAYSTVLRDVLARRRAAGDAGDVAADVDENGDRGR